MTRRATIDAPWTEPINLGAEVNSEAWDSAPYLSRDGLLLFFDSTRSDGYGSWDLYMARRVSVSDPWQETVNLGPIVNSSDYEENPQLSADGQTLYWGSSRPGGYGNLDLWKASVVPLVDFNGDGNVDCIDITIMTEFWRTSESLCDIAPPPFGDGFVDIQDLILLSEHLTSPTVDPNDIVEPDLPPSK